MDKFINDKITEITKDATYTETDINQIRDKMMQLLSKTIYMNRVDLSTAYSMINAEIVKFKNNLKPS
jgi:hypothetical protein